MATTITRRAVVGGALLAALATPLVAAPASAAGYTAVTIQGDGLTSPLEVRADADPELFKAVLSQVGWVGRRAPQTAAPAEANRGPKYTLQLYAKQKAKLRYDLYPMAAGGPRIFRPSKQPDQRGTTPGWFFGRLNMSETLRLAGVPLPIRADVLSGGIGGGAEEPTEDAVFAPMDEVTLMFEEWRRLFLLNGAVALLIAAGLAGVSLLIRPKT